jgi:hypothetical protein
MYIQLEYQADFGGLEKKLKINATSSFARRLSIRGFSPKRKETNKPTKQ